MALDHIDHKYAKEPPAKRTKWVLVGFFAVAGFFLLTEHRAHLYGALPYLLVLACPLMHFFHGHGGRHGSHGEQSAPPRTTAGSTEHARHSERKG